MIITQSKTYHYTMILMLGGVQFFTCYIAHLYELWHVAAYYFPWKMIVALIVKPWFLFFIATYQIIFQLVQFRDLLTNLS
jgi:hypothetical protein